MSKVKKTGIAIAILLFIAIIAIFVFLLPKDQKVEELDTTLVVDQSGTFALGDQYKEVIIKVPDVQIENGTADKILVAESVGDGDVTLLNVNSKELTLQGGGPNSITIAGSSEIQSIRLERSGGVIRVLVTDNSLVERTTIYEDSQDVILEGAFADIRIEASDIDVNINNASMDSLSVMGTKTTVYIDEKSTIQSASLLEGADDSKIVLNGSIENLTIEAKENEIKVNGKIASIDIKDGAENPTINLSEEASVERLISLVATTLNGEGTFNEVSSDLKANLKGNAKIKKIILLKDNRDPIDDTVSSMTTTGTGRTPSKTGTGNSIPLTTGTGSSTSTSTIAEELLTAKTDAKIELNNYKDAADYRSNARALSNAKTAGETTIDKAKTAEGVAKALKNAKTAIDGIKSDIDIALAKLAVVKNVAGEKTKADYTVTSWKSLEKALAKTEETVVEINEKATAIQEAMDALKTVKAVVKNEKELEAALNNTVIELIIFNNDIALSKSLGIKRKVTIDGQEFAVDNAVIITEDNVTIKNIQATVVDEAQHKLTDISYGLAFYVKGENVELDNVTIIGAEADATNARGITMDTGSNLAVKNSTIKNVKTGIVAHRGFGSAKIQNALTATGNTFDNVWAGIGVTEKTDLIATGNTFASIQLGGEGIGLGEGAEVKGSLRNDIQYLEGKNVFNYNVGNKVKNYRKGVVTNEKELKAALKDKEVKLIIFNDDIILKERLDIKRKVIIDGKGFEVDSAVIITADNVTLKNIKATVVDSTQHKLSGISYGLAFYIQDKNVELDNITIIGSEADATSARGITMDTGSNVAVKNSTIKNVKTGIVAHRGYGYSKEKNVLIATGNTFDKVWAGIGVTEKTDLIATGNTFLSIQSGGEGIGLGKGAEVVKPAENTLSDIEYLEEENTFNYDGNKVKDYR